MRFRLVWRANHTLCDGTSFKAGAGQIITVLQLVWIVTQLADDATKLHPRAIFTFAYTIAFCVRFSDEDPVVWCDRHETRGRRVID